VRFYAERNDSPTPNDPSGLKPTTARLPWAWWSSRSLAVSLALGDVATRNREAANAILIGACRAAIGNDYRKHPIDDDSADLQK